MRPLGAWETSPSSDEQKPVEKLLDGAEEGLRGKALGPPPTTGCKARETSGGAQREEEPEEPGSTLKVLEDFVEFTSGAKCERPKLKAALALCRQSGAKLLVAKLDRLSRVVSEIALLMDDKDVEFVVACFPQASRFELHLYAALAEQERQFISQRTKTALAVAKSRGVKLGGARAHLKAHNANQARKLELEAAAIAPFILPLKGQGASLRQITQTLSHFGLKTQRGSKWHPSRVAQVCHWLKNNQVNSEKISHK